MTDTLARRPRLLRDLKIDEVSSVDKGAGRGVRVLLMKRDRDMAAIDAMDERQVIAKIDEGIEAGELSKAAVGAFLDRRASGLRGDGESFEQAYVKQFVGSDGSGGSDVIGSALFKRFRRMPGLDHYQQAVMALASEPVRKREPDGDTPLGKLYVMAEELRKRDGTLTPEQAVAKAMQTPAGLAAYRADKDARLGPGF